MQQRGRYRTRQQSLVEGCLREHDDCYLTVDGVRSALAEAGEPVGRSTVYRHLESMVSDGAVLKVVGSGGESSYRLAPKSPSGQLVCLDCGKALPLDCSMLLDFSRHVRTHHGFSIEQSKSVLFGHCADCLGEKAHG